MKTKDTEIEKDQDCAPRHPHFLWRLAIYIIILLLGIVGFFGKVYVDKVDAFPEKYVTKSEIQDMKSDIGTIRADVKEILRYQRDKH